MVPVACRRVGFARPGDFFMPSQFEKQFVAVALGAMQSAFWIPNCTATPPNGGAVISGISVYRRPHDPMQTELSKDASGQMQMADLRVAQTDVPNVVPGMRFTIDGEVWTAETSPQSRNGQHYFTAKRAGSERLMPRRARE